MQQKIKKILPLILLLYSVLYILYPVTTRAQQNFMNVSPVIMDEKGYARDIIVRRITIKNNLNQRISIFVDVNDVEAEEGLQDFERAYGNDLAETFANWIEIKRNFEILPGEEKQIDITFRINLRAKPGIYHAQISFFEGPNRDAAEARGVRSQVLVNFEVKEDIKELIQLASFAPEKTFFSGFPISFNYELENIGNRALNYEGEIIIYNRRGVEVSSVDIKDLGAIAPNVSENFAIKWQKQEGSYSALASISDGLSSFGRYKAVLRMNYGVKNPNSVQDTVFFWIMPWHIILGMFVLIGILFSFIAHKIYKKRYTRFPEEKYTINLKINSE